MASRGRKSQVDESAFDPVRQKPLASRKERLLQGKALRDNVKREAQAIWAPEKNRIDPILLLEESSKNRLQNLVPIRYGRMLQSPFTFLRGSPIVMAQDLASTPSSGLQVQLGGDAHLTNFGVYASPERNLLFDINDFDETHPGPWEWDIKRLATSFVVAGRTFGLTEEQCQHAVRSCVNSYRRRMRRYASMRLLDVWYSRVNARAALKLFRSGEGRPISPRMTKQLRQRTLKSISKLTTSDDGDLRIIEDPPLITHLNEPRLEETIHRRFHAYYSTLTDDRKYLLERYRFLDFALKVVGIGSVGTRCYIVLLESCHGNDSLLLQIKEAMPSVLEAHLGKSRFANRGQRVVTGQRLMQSASDIFLGWMEEQGHHFYVRQLRDMKASAVLETMKPEDFVEYGRLCGWVLARAHARSGDAVSLGSYLGKNNTFDEAMIRFATLYADQNERDYKHFQTAVKQGRIPAEIGV